MISKNVLLAIILFGMFRPDTKRCKRGRLPRARTWQRGLRIPKNVVFFNFQNSKKSLCISSIKPFSSTGGRGGPKYVCPGPDLVLSDTAYIFYMLLVTQWWCELKSTDSVTEGNHKGDQTQPNDPMPNIIIYSLPRAKPFATWELFQRFQYQKYGL